jgi:SHAQKYF class myb-like DNA-binding protein
MEVTYCQEDSCVGSFYVFRVHKQSTSAMDDTTATKLRHGVWSNEEHERFVEGVRLFPNGPWKAIAERVGTRTVRQVQTHARNYQDRAARRLQELRHDHERLLQPKDMIMREMKEICESLQRCRVPLSPHSTGQWQRSVDQLARASEIQFGAYGVYPEADGSDCTIGQVDSNSVPSFDECIDFLLEVFGSTDYTSE